MSEAHSQGVNHIFSDGESLRKCESQIDDLTLEGGQWSLPDGVDGPSVKTVELEHELFSGVPKGMSAAQIIDDKGLVSYRVETFRGPFSWREGDVRVDFERRTLSRSSEELHYIVAASLGDLAAARLKPTP